MSTKKKNTDPENPVQINPETPSADLMPDGPEAPETPTLETPKTPEAPAGAGKGRKAKKSYPDYLQAYVDKYPTNKTFHVTTDRMVFLAPDKNLAVLHQNGIKGAGTVETYNI